MIHAVLRKAVEHAVREELVPRNVVKLVRVPAPQYEVGTGLTVAQGQASQRVAGELQFTVPKTRHIVQAIAGHSGIEVTMTIYAHAARDEQRKALHGLGERLG